MKDGLLTIIQVNIKMDINLNMIVIAAVISVISYFLKDTMTNLKKKAEDKDLDVVREQLESVKEIAYTAKNKLDILESEHNLRFEHLSEKFDALCDSVKDLTKEIKDLNKEFKKKD